MVPLIDINVWNTPFPADISEMIDDHVTYSDKNFLKFNLVYIRACLKLP